MRKTMLAGFAVIAVMATIAAFGANGTLTWFSGTENRSATVTTATINLHGVEGFPITVSGLMPSDVQTKTVEVKNVGSGTADFYVQMISDGVGKDFCNPTPVLDIRIRNVTDGWTPYGWASICNLYPGWSGSKIVKIADNVAPGEAKKFDVNVHLSTTAGNDYQGASNTDKVRLIAVQYNGPAPIPDNDGGLTIPQAEWPDDPYGDDDDPNYP
ncbi:MAG: hypothetical protein ACUVV3_06865 [Dehalococcoidia bacterium]